MESITGQLILKPKRDKPVRNRHPWIFSGAIDHVEGQPAPGDIVAVCDNNGRYLATATFNPQSQIQGRILTWNPNEAIDSTFWQNKLRRAIDGRNLLPLEPATTAYRLVNAEADGLPGLIVDKYGDYLVLQCLTLGIDRHKNELISLLAELCQPTGIIERSDAKVRRKEGLPLEKGLCYGDLPPPDLVIKENGISFYVNLLEGHKTGFYLDQRHNRLLATRSSFVSDKRVLNVFAYSGGFAVYAAANDAGQIINIDSSIPALELAEKNVALNAPARPSDEYIAGDAFEILRYLHENEELFDLVVLDPPKFVHSRRDLNRASRGYKDINRLALLLLRPGGVLTTFSCSGLVSADLFQKIVFGAALDAERDVQILQQLGQASDHPVLLSFPESAYLKGLLCRVW